MLLLTQIVSCLRNNYIKLEFVTKQDHEDEDDKNMKKEEEEERN